MTTACRLLSAIALYSDVANTFHVYPPHVICCRRTAPSGRSWHVATTTTTEEG